MQAISQQHTTSRIKTLPAINEPTRRKRVPAISVMLRACLYLEHNLGPFYPDEALQGGRRCTNATFARRTILKCRICQQIVVSDHDALLRYNSPRLLLFATERVDTSPTTRSLSKCEVPFTISSQRGSSARRTYTL